MARKALTYIGKDCKRKHGGERYKSTGACVECHKIRLRDYNARNRDSVRENWKRWYNENPEKFKASRAKRRAKKKAANGSYTGKELKTLLKTQQNKCACCSKSLTKFHVDHIMPLKLGGSNYIWNIQLLTPDCNLSKGALHPDEWLESLPENSPLHGLSYTDLITRDL